MKLTAAAAATLVVLSPWLPERQATACGGFFTAQAVAEDRKPSLLRERTLILYDDLKQREHFIREVTFRGSREIFGFVVPTPARPEVKKVEPSPFAKLEKDFPFHAPTRSAPRGAMTKSPQHAGSGVTVLEVSKVGSFTAFVLAADDDKALSAWLKKNKLTSTKETDAWLAHYVRMRFFFVAMRYDPPGADESVDTKSTQAETVRISFDSPLAYYPYYEPEREPPGKPRQLSIWLVSRQPLVPVVAKTRRGTTRWLRPFAEGVHYKKTRWQLAPSLGKAQHLLFSGAPQGLHVQRFEDSKSLRNGFGDVLFVPKDAKPLDEAAKKRLAPLLPILDPSLGAGS